MTSVGDTSSAPSHALALWANDNQVATLSYMPLDDQWSLDYAPRWIEQPGAFPLSPALPFVPPPAGYTAGAVKRFVENLLPEGRALDVTAATCRVAKANVYALISALGSETFGNGEHVRDIREGVSFERLFGLADQTLNKAAARLSLLRWALFQFLIGNSDAHGKNVSFFVHREGLAPAPWYDLVSVVQYPGIDRELAMAWGEAFALEEVSAFQLADFATRCQVELVRGIGSTQPSWSHLCTVDWHSVAEVIVATAAAYGEAWQPIAGGQPILHSSPYRLTTTPFKVLLNNRLYAPDSIDETGERKSGEPLWSDSKSMRRHA